MVVFSEEKIIIKVLVPRTLGCVYQDESITHLDNNLFAMDLESLGMSEEIKMFLFPFDFRFPGNVQNINFDSDELDTESEKVFSSIGGLNLSLGKRGELFEKYDNSFGRWTFQKHMPILGRRYNHSLLGYKRLIDFKSRTGTTFGGVDFSTALLRDSFHLVVLKKGVKSLSLLPFVEGISTKASENKNVINGIVLDLLKKGLDMSTAKGMGLAVDFVVDQISKYRRTSMDHPSNIHAVAENSVVLPKTLQPLLQVESIQRNGRAAELIAEGIYKYLSTSMDKLSKIHTSAEISVVLAKALQPLLQGDRDHADYLKDCGFPLILESIMFPHVLQGESIQHNALIIKQILHQIIASLKKIHSTGIVPQDAKPSNLATKKGKIKLIDYGAATDLRIGKNYIPNLALLDPDCCPPELDVMPEETPSSPPQPVAAFLSSLVWQLNSPDLFDMAIPTSRSPSGLKNFNLELKTVGYDLKEWQEKTRSRPDLRILDLDSGRECDLATSKGGFCLLEQS